MKDTIYRQDAIDAVNAYLGLSSVSRTIQNMTDIQEILEKLPSAEPEIIRCKDCRHWFDIDDGRQKHKMCADLLGDWFCADAERRTDEQIN